MLARLLALTGAAVVAFALCEIAARIATPRPPDRARQPPLAYLTDTAIKYVLAPNQQGWIDDGLVNVNSLGFRGKEIAVPKPSGRFRIVTIGDSLTIGMGVQDDETFSAQLERALIASTPRRDVDVANLGVPGYDTRQEVGLLERNLQKLEPDLVVVGFYTNDVPDALHTEATPGGTQILANDAGSGRVMHMDSTSPSFADRYLRKIRLVYLSARAFNMWRGSGEAGMARLTMEFDLLRGNSSPELEQAWAIVGQQFKHLHDLALTHRFRVVVVGLPPRELVAGQFDSGPYRKKLEEIAAPLGFAIIDPVPVMRESGVRADRLFIPYDRNHPNADGHRLIAAAIAGGVRGQFSQPSQSGR